MNTISVFLLLWGAVGGSRMEFSSQSFSCDCLHNNIVLESLVVVLTLVSALAVTGENLLLFDLITVPHYAGSVSNITSGNESQHGGTPFITENTKVMDILTKVFHYASLGIAGLFLLEILLKVCTVQKKCFTNPWQIFDAVVVVATLTLELVFHFVLFSERALSSLTYLVLLRLWRLPMICSIRANEVQEASDCDNELYRSGRLKAEEKCRMLEKTILQQAETIIKLERLLHNVTSSQQSDTVIGDCHIINNGHIKKTPTINDTISIQYESLSSCSSEKSSHSNLLSNPQKQSKNISHHDTETSFTIKSEAEIPTSVSKFNSQTLDVVHHRGTLKEDTKIYEDKIRATDINSKTVDCTKSHPDCVYGAVKSITQIQTQPFSETLNTSHVPSSRQAQILLRQRKRRSSASEILDYNSMNSSDMDSVFYENDKTASCQNFDLEHEKLFSNDIHEKHFSNNNNITHRSFEKNVNTATDSGDKFTSLSKEEKNMFHNRKKTRRFVSCPEYVFTQRMNISNDESMLLEDGHTTDDHMVFNNLGFDFGENASFQVVAEYDGTKTYRNEDGIPMTSL